MKAGPRRQALFGLFDRYVARVFASAYLLAALLVVGLFFVVDLASNLDDYLKPTKDGTPTPIGKVARYYLLNLPFLYLQVAPFVTLIAGLFTVARLQRAREVIAALSAGVSARRLLAPVFVGALLLTGALVFAREYVVNTIGFERGVLRVELDEHTRAIELEKVRPKDVEGRMFQVDRFWLSTPEPDALDDWDRRGFDRPRFEGFTAVREESGVWQSYRAAAGRWDAASATWRLEGGRLEVVDTTVRDERPLETLTGALAFTPHDVWLAWKGRNQTLDLSFAEASELARRDPQNVQYRTLRLYFLSFPLANIVLLLVGLPFLLQYERGRGAEGLVAGFLLCVVYFAVDFVTLNLGMQGQIGPVWACGLPAVVFGSLGLVLTGTLRT
jgi:lipopolysaccharide export system permease protein